MANWRSERMNDSQNLDIGQHWLVDEQVLSIMANQAQRGAKVLEIGAGKGQLTERLALVAGEVTAVEIDKRRFQDLNTVASQHSNVKVLITDAQRIDFRKYRGYQVIGNLPYNITEPFITRVAGTPIKLATLMIGENFADEVTGDDEKSFGKLRMLVKTFFHISRIAEVNKHSFSPPPRTESVILEFTPRTSSEFKNDQGLFVKRELFTTASHSPKIQSALREALIKHAKEERGVMGLLSGAPVLTKNQAREMVVSLCLPETLLETPLEQLSNEGLLELDTAINTHFG